MLLGKGKIIRFRNGKMLGIIRRDKTFMVFRKEKKHLFRIYNGWGINKELLEELKDIGIKYIEIQATDTGYIYRTVLGTFEIFGIPYQNPKNEHDYQIVLPLKFWKKYPMLDKRDYRKAIKRWNNANI